MCSPDIQIVNVKPVPGSRSEFANREVPPEISAFYLTNEVDTFKFDRPYYRGDKDKNNEFKVSIASVLACLVGSALKWLLFGRV